MHYQTMKDMKSCENMTQVLIKSIFTYINKIGSKNTAIDI